MWKNHFILALRNLLRSKAFSAINILGLAIGIATCLVILLFIRSELGYDSFHEKADRIVRVVFRGSVQGEEMNEAHVMPPVAEALLADYPEVEEATRLRLMGFPKITYADKSFRNNSAAFADPSFFRVFTFPLIQGSSATALNEPNTVVLTESSAKRIFGREDPLGKVLLMYDGNTSLKVTGIMADMPVNSHFHFDVLVSMATFPEARNPSWMVSEFYTYLVLPPSYDYRKLEEKLPAVTEKYIGPQLQESMGISFDKFRQAGNTIGLFLQPLKSIHLYSDMRGELGSNGDIQYLYIFGAVAVFMLLIACINFINLSTASASKRAKEIGIRKTLGSRQRQLISQFLIESILLSYLALAVAVLLVKLALPVFNELSGKNLELHFLSDEWIIPSLILLGGLVGLMAGVYPAFFLSSFKPISAMKGSSLAASGGTGKNNITLRSTLVVFQFAVAVVLITGTMVVYHQLQYIQNKNLGYDKDQVLILPEVWQLGNNAEAFRQQLLQDSRIKFVSTSGYLPSGPSYNNNFFLFPEEDASGQIKALRYEVDDQYLPTLGLELLMGRNFSDEFGTEDESIILNETAVEAFGWSTTDALGKTLTHASNGGGRTTYRVIGVVKDFHFRSMHESISPLVMTRGEANGSVIAKVQTTDVSGLVNSIQKQWTALADDEPFEYSFLDERFFQTYNTERKMGYILSIFALLTIFVACMGLFGLATFTTKLRTKEIGIRKVLGAEVSTIIALLSKDYLRLVTFAAAIAFPLAWWAMEQWLEGFAYRVDISFGLYIAAGATVAVVAFLTVSYEAIKAALMNPIDSLRNE
jgi:putative ABC transport system permease protein